ncbi:MAG: V-type ATPase subunit [Parcubacteria group bacterium]
MSYNYAAAKIRALEKRLLSQNDLNLMVDAKNAEDSFAVFNDTNLADNLLRVKTREFEKAITEELKQSRKLIEDITDDKKVLKLIFLKNDFHNVKVFFKEKANGKVYPEKLISDLGLVRTDDLERRILKGDKKIRFEKDFESTLQKIEKRLIGVDSPDAIDNICDQEYFKLMADLSKDVGSRFIEDYFKLQLDSINLRVLFRGKATGRPLGTLKDIFFEGGRFSKKDLLLLYPKDENQIIEFLRLRLFPSEKIWFEDYFKERRLWQLEKALDDMQMEYLKKSKLIAAGPEVIFAYIFANYNSLKNIRIIMVAKWNNILDKEIRRRVRQLF